MIKKLCNKCGIKKPLSEFYKAKNTKDGLGCWCKDCKRENSRKNKPTPEEYRNRINLTIDRHMVAIAKQRAKKGGIKFNLKPGDIQVPEKCPLLGIPIKRGRGHCCAGSPTLDRINPSRGYIKDNVWVISYRANLIKSNATPEEIIMVGENLKKFIHPTLIVDQTNPFLHIASLLGAPKNSSLHFLITRIQDILAKNQLIELDLAKTKEKLSNAIENLKGTLAEITTKHNTALEPTTTTEPKQK